MRSKDARQLIPTLLDLNGKIIEHAREIGKLKAVVGKLASLESFVVGAAHIISGADVAKTVEEVRNDVKFLVEGRKNEHLGKLEAAFRTAKQRLDEPQTEANRSELRSLMHEIAILRAIWRRDLETKLENIKNPKNAGFIKRFFTRQRSSDKRVAGDISEFQRDVDLIEVSLVIQIGIAQATGDAEALFLCAVPDELKLLRKTSQLLSEKAGYIILPQIQVTPIQEAMKGLIGRMSALVPSEQVFTGESERVASS